MNILVCFNDNDYLITRINCTLKEAKDYYIDKSFTYWNGEKEQAHIAKVVIDVDKSFDVSYKNDILDDMAYIFKTTNNEPYANNPIILLNQTRQEDTEIEPNWFWKNTNRIIKQL